MHRWRASSKAGDESGTAALEFVVAGVLMLVPLAYLVVTLGLIQEKTMGVDAGARFLARSIATADSAEDARNQSDRVLTAVADEYNLNREDLDIGLTCTPAGISCPRAGVMLTVTMRAEVALPLVPSLFSLDDRARVTVESRSVQRVARYWSEG